MASPGRNTSRLGIARSDGEMLDRLMGRAVLAEADGVVRHHMDDADAHQRRQPDRRAAVIGEGQEGAAIGNEAAMQRDAVHRRRHARARGRRSGCSCRRRNRGRTGRCVLARVRLEWVRSAEPPSKFGSASAIASITSCEACRVAMVGPFGAEAASKLIHRGGVFARQFPVQRIVKRRARGASRDAWSARSSSGGPPARACRSCAIARRSCSGISNG